jgi:hypothetical protein
MSDTRRFLNIKLQEDRRKKVPEQKVILDWQEPGKKGWAKHGLEEAEPAMDSFHEKDDGTYTIVLSAVIAIPGRSSPRGWPWAQTTLFDGEP